MKRLQGVQPVFIMVILVSTKMGRLWATTEAKQAGPVLERAGRDPGLRGEAASLQDQAAEHRPGSRTRIPVSSPLPPRVALLASGPPAKLFPLPGRRALNSSPSVLFL